MHISKARQLLGLLNFCLLSGAESEMERIDLLSTGGALPWAGPLACSLAWLPCRGLSFSSLHPPTPPPPPLCMAAASPPADTCPAVTGRDVRWAADTRIDLPPFPHKLHIKLLETLKETKNRRRVGMWRVGGSGRKCEGRGGGEYCHLPSSPQTNNVRCREGIEEAECWQLYWWKADASLFFSAKFLLAVASATKNVLPPPVKPSWARLNYPHVLAKVK